MLHYVRLISTKKRKRQSEASYVLDIDLLIPNMFSQTTPFDFRELFDMFQLITRLLRQNIQPLRNKRKLLFFYLYQKPLSCVYLD